MKHSRLATYLTLLILLAVGCAGIAEPSPTQEADPGSTETAPTVTLSPTPNRYKTLSAANDLTATVRAKTPTKTSSPTVFLPTRSSPTPTLTPTITPTFDFSKFQTNIPALAARCPQFEKGILATPDFYDLNRIRINPEEVLDYLNAYGPDSLITFYSQREVYDLFNPIQAYSDYTNDGERELVFGWSDFFIFGCKDGMYALFYQLEPVGMLVTPSIIQVRDGNRNGIPELSLSIGHGTQGGQNFQVIEWDGSQFQIVLKEFWIFPSNGFGSEDIDRDGYLEYVGFQGIPVWGSSYHDGIPWRRIKFYFRWNGKEYNDYKHVFSPPEYRFQAVQDGDRALLYGEIEQALDFYRQAIYKETLGWWSPDREQFIWDVYVTTFTNDPTPIPPTPDPVEYDNLAAYARFKLMVAYAEQGWHADAKIMFDNIQRMYPEDKVGHPYAELASTFWDEYEPSRSIAAGCQAANDFASSHEKEILFYIQGAGGFAPNRINYEDEPWYICPFR